MKHLRLLLAVLVAGLIGMSVAHAQATRLAWTTPPTGAQPGAAFLQQPTIDAQDVNGIIDTTYSGPITVAIKAGTDTGGAVLQGTTTVNAVFGTATFTDLKIALPGNYVLQATAPGLAEGDSSVVVVVTLSEVYATKLPDTVDTTQLISGWNQIRAFAVNSNPGSAYKGTMYLSRRAATNAAVSPPVVGTADVFFWRATATNPAAVAGSGVLKAAGPDYLHPDGRFDLTGLTPGANTFWGIGVDEDDYVYAGGLNSGSLFRFNPDGTGGLLVIPSNFGSGKFVRNIYVKGKGLGTTIYYIQGDASTAVEKWVASAVDANNAPTAFTKTKMFDVTEAGNQRWKIVPNSVQDTLYYIGNFGAGPVKYSAAGAKDAAFPAWTLSGGTGLDIDSQDRILFVSYNTAQGFTAFSARNGNNITDKADGSFLEGGGLLTPIFTANSVKLDNNSNGLMACRYSDRHYVWFQSDSDHSGGGATGSYQGVVSTNMPAAAPIGVSIANPGTGNSLTVNFALPRDPEAVGVDIYVSPTAGVLGVKNNASTVTTSPYTISGLTAGVPQFITVQTVSADALTGAPYTSVNVNQTSGTPSLILPPDPPTDITATDTKKGGEILVGWTTPALYADNINIYRSIAAGDPGSIVKVVAAPTAGAPATWLDKTVANGTPYFYTVKAVNGKGEESPNTAQVTATPTDQTVPTFAGLATTKDYGFPGVRLTWANAVDNSPVTYNIYVASTFAGFNLSNPLATTTDTKYDLRGLTLNETVYVWVKATDSAGNTDANNRIVDITPNRVIVDPDQNAPANSNLVNLQPDAGLPALQPSSIGSSKGAADDLFPTGFAPNTYFFSTNDKKGKVLYTVPINAAGTYDIAADWLNDVAVITPNVRFSITKPDGSVMPDVFLDETGGTNGSMWNLITSTPLTMGNMTVLVDFTTSPDVDPLHISAAPAIRAILPPRPVSIYQATTAPTIDGNISDAEWKAYPTVSLGKPSQDLLPGKWTGPADYSAAVKLKWDAAKLYIAYKTTDDVLALPIKSTTTPETLWDNDSLEVYLGLDPAATPGRTAYGAGDYQFIVSGFDDVTPGTITGTAQAIQADFTLVVPQVAFVKTASGYNVEAAIPWACFSAFPIAPAANQVIGFNLHGNDNDSPTVPGADSVFSLSGLAGSYNNPSAWTTAQILAGLPPAPVKGDANGDGAFNTADVKRVLQIAAGLLPATDQALTTSDVFPAGAPDGKIDLRDALRLDRALNGKDTL